MIFENGERVMTYQSSKTLTDSEKELMQQKFETLKTDEIYLSLIHISEPTRRPG